MDEKASPSKNNDCYFYYYSSCSKGDACPFRHEPSALRNETVCIFWLQGNCSKANCIFRHMELTKQRDKIACWFETQPGGCKKPHCSFQHQNILDHPREEDIKKKPDLILPVRKEDVPRDETEAVNSEETERQIIPPRNESGSLTPPRQAYFSPIPRNPIIVPLQDGESDSESVSGSPYKRGNPELSAQLEWELRKLRQIQAYEADIIGYVFADDIEEGEEERLEDGNIVQNQEVEEYVVEEILEVEEETDAAHRRLHPPPKNTLLSAQVKSYPDPVVNDLRKEVLKPKVRESKIRRKVQITERFGGVASRALAETLGTSVQLRKSGVKRFTNRIDEQINVNSKVITERRGHSLGKKFGITDRLGTRHRKEPSWAASSSSEEESSPVVDRSIASRIMAIRNQQTDEDVHEDSDAEHLQTSGFTKANKASLDFTVKSLADIRAEKQKKIPVKKVVQPSSGIKNGTKFTASARKEIKPPTKEGHLKILSLSEIKAKQQSLSKNNTSSGQEKKRSISPVSFLKHTTRCKMIKISSDHNSVQETSSTVTAEQNVPLLGTRKITINRSVKKSINSEPSSKIQHIETKEKKQGSVSGIVNIKIKGKSVDSSKNNNNVMLGKTKTLVNVCGNQPPSVGNKNPVTEKQSSSIGAITSSISRHDSLADEEEELLLGGDMLELEDDVDEAALLL